MYCSPDKWIWVGLYDIFQADLLQSKIQFFILVNKYHYKPSLRDFQEKPFKNIYKILSSIYGAAFCKSMNECKVITILAKGFVLIWYFYRFSKRTWILPWVILQNLLLKSLRITQQASLKSRNHRKERVKVISSNRYGNHNIIYWH